VKLGCCAYSYREKLQAGEMTMTGFLDECVKLEFDGVELTSYYFAEADRGEVLKLKRECFVRGLEVSGTAVGTNFCNPDDDARRADVQKTRQWMYYGSIMGAPFIRVFAGGPAEGDTEQAAFERCVACLEELLPHAEAHGIIIGLENHGGITSTAEQVERIVRAVTDSPWLCINLDTGNYKEPERELPMTAPHVLTVHAKRRHRGTDGEMHDVDYDLVRRVLADEGYRGYINMEYEEPEDPMTGVPSFMEVLKRAFRG
jgi:sugar phosphate isomerase/epimerase